jgi:hypothetical protein
MPWSTFQPGQGHSCSISVVSGRVHRYISAAYYILGPWRLTIQHKHAKSNDSLYRLEDLYLVLSERS